MRVRPYCAEDEADLKSIHASQDLGYEFPDLSEPLYFVKLVVVDSQGKLRAAGIARLTAEVFILSDPTLGAQEKKEALDVLLAEGESRMLEAGMSEYHSFLPPKMNGLERLLCTKYGFVPDEWPSVFRQIGG